jgi:hypothetical protein
MRDKIERKIFLVGAPLYIPPKEIIINESEYNQLISELNEANMCLMNGFYPGTHTKIVIG